MMKDFNIENFAEALEEAHYKGKYTLENILSFKSSILIGSRALNVHTEKSDFDICILLKDLPKQLKKIKKELSRYFIILPLNNSYLIRKYRTKDNIIIDIIIYTKQSDLKIIKKAIKDTRKIPKYLLKDKPFRVMSFEKSLLHYGFKETIRVDEL